MKIPDLPQSPVMVRILMTQHADTSDELRNFVKFYVKSLFFCIPWLPLSLLIFQQWVLLGITILTVSYLYISIFNKVKKMVNLSMVGQISFISSNNTRLINMEDVHNTSLLVCEMRGCIKGAKAVLVVLNVCIVSLTFLNLALNILNLILGGVIL